VKGKNKQHAEIYQGANYFLLEDLFLQLQKINVKDGFLDIGCGKGRAMVVAAHYGFQHITGIDFAAELCKHATQNCQRIADIYPSASWKVIHADAENFLPAAHVHIIFLFNPFKELIMKRVIRNILKSLDSYPRKLFVVYVNPQLKHLFTEQGFKEVYYIRKMPFVEASILESL
jgi:SAM-dependent methyltransferase